MKIENKVKLTDVSEEFIQNLDKRLHEFKNYKLVFVFINYCYKV